ncbi:single-stranded DNA-binding protein [Ruminococcus sp.]|uniref:single-stranded DNA-binding protein n=1 Tax=Ruminococcus sp. TaxID=41978 RepID=UPI0025EE4AC4|nr:single-stranded DNA-binding protein [Ruminococcus sp.]MBQ6252482.1 single-stranded DNA-binding protein [Ruminococcus sp.]
MNQIVLIGRLTADPVLEKTDSGVSKCKFSLAVQDGAANKNGEKEVDFINSIAWRSTAEFISKYFKKGSLIGVIGKLKIRPYEKDGEKRYATFVNVSNAEFVGYNKSQSGENANIDEPDLSAEFDEILTQEESPF